VRLHALEVADEDSTQVSPVIDLVARQVLEPCACRVTEVERQILNDEEVIGRSTSMACEPVVLEPYAGVGVPIVSRHIGRGPEVRVGTLRDLAGLVTSWARGRHRCFGTARIHGRRGGTSGCRSCCRCSQHVVGPRWCSGRHGWARVDS
jgi:hypothetical protein